ncbi:hypothetical protein [Pelosinus propionicus]|uniref:Uncharacterized protein n=1 Tax=Pelosinus propionicus DSM 13327 TaxID=1123291 RepID=A0A1I4N2V9_9FIRM|nr:hypothetical protein [Pelosinus propionicus]SFM09914.1 hypothetical protein SAMN04490355_104074 [Pelosinus propionicus DSM 13327]
MNKRRKNKKNSGRKEFYLIVKMLTKIEKEMVEIKQQLEDRPKSINETIHINAISSEKIAEWLKSNSLRIQQLFDQRK